MHFYRRVKRCSYLDLAPLRSFPLQVDEGGGSKRNIVYTQSYYYRLGFAWMSPLSRTWTVS